MAKVNPFSSRQPASPQHFSNRKNLLERFRKSVLKSAKSRPPRPNNIAILGDWGMGKTSMLLKFENMVLKEFKGKMNILSVIVTLKPASCMDINVFSETLVHKIKNACKVNDTSIVSKIKNATNGWEVKTIEIPHVLKIGRKKEEKVKIDLTETLKDLWANLKNDVDICILMLDDLHYFLPRYPDGLFDLRNTFQELTTNGCNYMVAVTGPKILYQEVRDIAEPLTRFFDPFFLNCFDLSGTEDAVLKPIKVEKIPIKVEKKVIKKIHSITSGHPYFVAFVMEFLLDEVKEGTINMRVFNKFYPKIAKRIGESRFKTDFERVSDKEKEALIKISRVKKELVKPSDIKYPTEIFSRLVVKDLLIKESRGQYRLYHPLFKQFLKSVKS